MLDVVRVAGEKGLFLVGRHSYESQKVSVRAVVTDSECKIIAYSPNSKPFTVPGAAVFADKSSRAVREYEFVEYEHYVRRIRIYAQSKQAAGQANPRGHTPMFVHVDGAAFQKVTV